MCVAGCWRHTECEWQGWEPHASHLQQADAGRCWQYIYTIDEGSIERIECEVASGDKQVDHAQHGPMVVRRYAQGMRGGAVLETRWSGKTIFI